MGGKTKQSQRTKNNARPSSSGRSAELLNNAVNLETWKSPGGASMAALFPTLSTPLIDQSLSSEFSVCIKKLNKKDPITKTKALQELTELVNNSKVDDVVAALNSWVHFYKILTVDTDCKVRECAQACHAAIARACGRRLAPALRQLVPAWLQAQYDDHAPAQTHAANSLKATFPENKLPEVISFCKAEIVAHLLENLTGSGDKAIINRSDSPEERALQQQRLVAASLQGLRFLARHLGDAHRDWLWDQLAPLFASNAFWKLANHPAQTVRGAWFSALGSVVERFGVALDAALAARCGRVVLVGAHDPQPAAAHHVWACLLALMYSVPDWSKWMDKNDLLTKRILDMLEKGGWGDARRLSDMLLPLLAHLPPDLLTKDFYDAFFAALFKGLEKKNILTSKSERQYWITSLSECLRYLSIQPHEYVVEVATSVHRTWLKKVLSTENDAQVRNNLVKHSATSMAALVKYWLKQSKEPNGEKYDQLVRNFWQNVASTVLGQIDHSDVEMATKVIDGHILLLQTLKTAFLSEGKKTQTIKFDGDAPTETEKSAPMQDIDPASVERYNHNLNEAVEKVCCGYFEFADKKEIIDTVLSPLITILNEFDSKNLYIALAKHFGANSLYEWYDKLLRRWMVTDTTRCKSVVDVIFIMLKHLSEDEQDAILESFDQLPGGALEWCVSRALAHEQWGAARVRRWLRGRSVERLLLALARRLLQRGCPRARNLLFMCLSHDNAAAERAEMMISPSTASGIARVVSSALSDALTAATNSNSAEAATDQALELEQVAALAAHLATALASHPADDSYQDLVLNLFHLLLLVPRGDPRLSPETWVEARSGAHDGLHAAARRRVLPRAAALLREHLRALDDMISTVTLEHMASLCPHVLAPAAGLGAAPDADAFTEHLFSVALNEKGPPVDLFALRYDCIVGNLNCPIEDDNELIKLIVQEADSENPTELTRETFIPYANKLLFRAIYLRTIFLQHDLYDDDDDDQASTEAGDEDKEGEKTEKKIWCNELLEKEYFQQQFCELLRECMVVNSLNEGYGFWPHHDLIKQTKSKLDGIVEAIISATNDSLRAQILTQLSARALAEGYYWAFARSYYEARIGRDPEVADLAAGFDVDKLTGNGFFHCLQANAERCKDETAQLQAEFALMTRSVVAAYGPDEAFVSQALAACERCDLDPVIAFYHQHQKRMLYEKSISELSWAALVSEARVARCMEGALRRGGWEAAPHHWDFATVGLCTLLEAVRKPHPHYTSTKVALIAHATFRLYTFVEEFISSIRGECERRQPQPHVLQLASEWRDVFAPALNRDLYLVLLSLLENTSAPVTSGLARVAAALGAAAARSDWRLLDAAHRAHSLSLQRVTTRACNALASALHPARHVLAYRTLRGLLDALADFSEEQLAAWSAGASEEGADRARPQLAADWFLEPFGRAIELTDAALSGYEVGVESCEMAAGSDAHALALGCALLADALHRLAARARGDLQHHYIQAYRENQFTEWLVPAAMRLIPSELLAAALTPHAPLPPRYAAYFQDVPAWRADDAAWWSGVGLVACRALGCSVSGAGAAGARAWRGAAARAGRALARLVAAYVAPALVKRQLDQLVARKAELEDTEVSVHWASHEAALVYRVEERSVELRVRFDADFPLSLPRVSASAARPAVATSWVAMYIAYQNGTLLKAAQMWIAAINSRVESSPPCYVCYCRLHPATGHLPQVRCHQCQNRYHTSCLHKWFVSSHKSNCPLCRSHF